MTPFPVDAERRPGRGARSASGFTLLEALVYLVFGGLVVSSVHFLMMRHQREFHEQQRETRSQVTVRNALVHVVGELRSVSAGGGDLLQMDPNAVRFRSYRGGGVVCAIQALTLDPTFTIAFAHGAFAADRPDSVMVLALYGAGEDDDRWRPLKALSALAPPDGTLGFPCLWATPTLGPVNLVARGDTAGIRLGSPVRAFRHIEYGLYPWNGEWWLGRRGLGAPWEPLIGPLLSPPDSGLVLSYLDADGNPATQPSQVALIDILVRAARDPRQTVIDSLRTRVALRG